MSKAVRKLIKKIKIKNKKMNETCKRILKNRTQQIKRETTQDSGATNTKLNHKEINKPRETVQSVDRYNL